MRQSNPSTRRFGSSPTGTYLVGRAETEPLCGGLPSVPTPPAWPSVPPVWAVYGSPFAG